MPESLLDEVTALVEWPVVYECKFEDEFLAVPQECLILTMQTNQKYFALTDANGKLRSRFLIVSNMETARRNTSSAATSAWCVRACPMPSSSSSRTRRNLAARVRCWPTWSTTTSWATSCSAPSACRPGRQDRRLLAATWPWPNAAPCWPRPTC
jgi:hypothetical protein